MQHMPAPSELFVRKTAYFYREGDQRFQPIRLVMKRKDYPHIEALINYLNGRMWLPHGVQSLFTPDGRHRITDLDEIENEGHYICSSSETRGQAVNINNMQTDNWKTFKSSDQKTPGRGNADFLAGRRGPHGASSSDPEDEAIEEEIHRIEEELYGAPRNGRRKKGRSKSLKRLSAPKRSGNFVSLTIADISKPTSRGLSLPVISNGKPSLVGSNNNTNRESWPRNNLGPQLAMYSRSTDHLNDLKKSQLESYASQRFADPNRAPGFRHWTVRVATGEMPSGYSTSIVYMTIHGRSGSTPRLTLASEQNLFRSGTVEIFRIRTPNVGTVSKLRLETSHSGPQPDWYCEHVVLEDEYSMERFPFICKNWFSRSLGDRCTYREIPAFGENHLVPGSNRILYEITVQTGDMWNAGTTGKVYLTLFGDRGSSTTLELNNPKNHEHEPFQKNQVDIFRQESLPLGEIRHIRVVHVHAPTIGIGAGWYLDNIAIRENDLHTQFHFPAWRWLSQHNEDRKLACELRAVDNYNYVCLQDRLMWPYERWKFRFIGAELVFYSAVSKKGLRITPGGYIDARGETQDRQGVFQIYDIEENEVESIIAIVNKSDSPSFFAFNDKKQLVSKTSFTKNCKLRLHIFSNRTVSFESYKVPNNHVSVASNGQLYTESQLKAQASQSTIQQFYVYVRGCFRDKGLIMLCTSRLQTLCIDRDPSALTALGARNRVAHFRVHKVQPKVRMFECVIFPGHFLQAKKKSCDCNGKGDRLCQFKLQRCREENYVVLESVVGHGYVGFTETGLVRVINPTKSGANHNLCRIYPEAIEFGRRKNADTLDLMVFDNDPQVLDTTTVMIPPPHGARHPNSIENGTIYHEPGAPNMLPVPPIAIASYSPDEDMDASTVYHPPGARTVNMLQGPRGSNTDRSLNSTYRQPPPSNRRVAQPYSESEQDDNRFIRRNPQQKRKPPSDMLSTTTMSTQQPQPQRRRQDLDQDDRSSRQTNGSRQSDAQLQNGIARRRDAWNIVNEDEEDDLYEDDFENYVRHQQNNPPSHQTDDHSQVPSQHTSKQPSEQTQHSTVTSQPTHLQPPSENHRPEVRSKPASPPPESNRQARSPLPQNPPHNSQPVTHQQNAHHETKEQHRPPSEAKKPQHHDKAPTPAPPPWYQDEDEEEEKPKHVEPQHKEPHHEETKHVEPDHHKEPKQVEPAHKAGHHEEPKHVEPHHDETKHGDPVHKEPHHEGAKHVEPAHHEEPKHVEPVRKESHHEEPKRAEPVHKEPHEEPKHAEPKHDVKEPHHESPHTESKHEEPKHEAKHDEPKHSEPKHEDPKISEAKHDEPKHSESKHDEPKHEEPKHSEAKHEEPKNSEPKHEDPKHSEAKHEEPKHSEPKLDEPKHSESKHPEPKHEEPIHSEGKHEEPKHSEPKHEEPKHSEAKHEEAEHSEPKHEEAKHEEPKHSEAKHEEPKHSEPKHEEPKHETSEHSEAKHEEPKPSEPKHEEPKHSESKHPEPKHEESSHSEPKHDETKKEAKHDDSKPKENDAHETKKENDEKKIETHGDSKTAHKPDDPIPPPKHEEPKAAQSKPEESKNAPPKHEEKKLDEGKKEEPKPSQPKKEEPKKEEPKKEEPKPAQPKKEEPKKEEPKKEEPKPVQPKKEEPKKEEPKPAQPKKEEPKKEEPKPVQPKKEEPKKEEPKPAQPKKEEPKKEEPKKEEPQKEAPPHHPARKWPIGPAPTVKPAPTFNAKQDSEALNKAMKGGGTDEDALVTVLTRRSYEQREEIARVYKQLYSKELMADIQEETDGNFLLVLTSLMKNPIDLAASNLSASVATNGKDEDGLAEVICTASHPDLQEIKQRYQELFKKPLEQELGKGGNAVLRKLLASMLSQAPAPETVDGAMAKADAKKLDGELKEKNNEKSIAAFHDLLTTRSRPQLRETFNTYEKDNSKTMEAVIKSEFKGDAQKAFLAAVTAIRNQTAYFAQRLNSAMNGFGPKNVALIRIIVSRCENDLELIKQDYEKFFKKTLAEDVAEETFGDFETALTSLVKGNST